ncbi:MAG: hypothetical protein ACRDD8_15970 [Bacteroidales bacterium]
MRSNFYDSCMLMRTELFDNEIAKIITTASIIGLLMESDGGDAFGASMFGAKKRGCAICDDKVIWATKDLNFIAKRENGAYAWGYESLTSHRKSAKVYNGNIVAEMWKDGHDIRDFDIEYIEDIQEKI